MFKTTLQALLFQNIVKELENIEMDDHQRQNIGLCVYRPGRARGSVDGYLLVFKSVSRKC